MNLKKIEELKKDAKLGLAGLVGIFFLFFITNPNMMPIAFILVMPTLIALSFFVIARFFLRLLIDTSDQQLNICSYALSGGILLVFLLGSLKQLGVQDVILSFLLAGGLAFYFTRSSEAQS